MSVTGLPAFDSTVQQSNLWLKDLMTRLGTEDREDAYHALRAVLHAVRDRIGPENVVHLGAQLPMLIRGVYYDGWHMGERRRRSAIWRNFWSISASGWAGASRCRPNRRRARSSPCFAKRSIHARSRRS